MKTPRIARILLPALALGASVGLRAGDEDISPSAYQVFDPETGFMVPADSLQEGSTNHAATAAHPPAADDGHPQVAEEGDAGPSIAIYAGAALVIALLAAALLRRRRRA